jgi:hypothetical protein
MARFMGLSNPRNLGFVLTNYLYCFNALLVGIFLYILECNCRMFWHWSIRLTDEFWKTQFLLRRHDKLY